MSTFFEPFQNADFRGGVGIFLRCKVKCLGLLQFSKITKRLNSLPKMRLHFGEGWGGVVCSAFVLRG